MIQDTVPLISIPIVLIYMAIIVKKNTYAYGGLLLLVLIFLAFTKPDFFVLIFNKYVPWFPARTVIWFLFILTMIVSIIFIIYCYRQETSGKYSTVLKDDFKKLLKPNIANVVFWVFIVILNLIISRL